MCIIFFYFAFGFGKVVQVTPVSTTGIWRMQELMHCRQCSSHFWGIFYVGCLTTHEGMLENNFVGNLSENRVTKHFLDVCSKSSGV